MTNWDDTLAIGHAIHAFARELWPLPRSISGTGLRATLAAIARLNPGLRPIEVQSGSQVLDWIVPAASGDEAPLSAAATNDALARLQALGRKVPLTTDVYVNPVLAPTPTPPAATAPQQRGRLRVAHGLPFNDYIGTAIAWAPARNGPMHDILNTTTSTARGALRYHLLLVESVPAGTEGTTVPRQIVRNLLEGEWSAADARPQGKNPYRWMETRPMRTPEGAQAERLHMVGWVDDAHGQVVAAAQSACR